MLRRCHPAATKIPASSKVSDRKEVLRTVERRDSPRRFCAHAVDQSDVQLCSRLLEARYILLHREIDKDNDTRGKVKFDLKFDEIMDHTGFQPQLKIYYYFT
jgi:uncharacterized protein involved in type VI secretion and phage assembly